MKTKKSRRKLAKRALRAATPARAAAWGAVGGVAVLLARDWLARRAGAATPVASA